jgi:hypothetical protein
MHLRVLSEIRLYCTRALLAPGAELQRGRHWENVSLRASSG